ASAATLVGSPLGGTFSGAGITGDIFTPSIATAGLHTITYTYTDGNSCVNSTTQNVTVNALPIVSFTGLNSAYCVDASAATLVGSPLGGTFSGAGISGDIFTPSIATAGLHTITYTYTDGNSCTNSTTQNVTVNALPIVSFTGLNSAYCVDASAATLVGSPLGGTFSGAGVSGSTFTPAIATAGLHTITYTYTDGNSCVNSTTQNVTVNALPIVSFTGLNSAYCVDASAATLVGSPLGGTFSGAGISGDIFTPSIATAGLHTITYTYTDGNSCTNSATHNVTVNALPTVSFTGLNSAYCLTAAAANLVGSPLGGTFSGAGVSGSTFTPSIATAGLHTITYTYTDGNSCVNSTTQNVTVNALPIVSFTGLNSAYCVDASAATLVGSPLGGTFSGAGISGDIFTPSIATSGLHTITYTYTDGNSCVNSTTQNVTVNALPIVTPGTYATQCTNSSPLTLGGSPSGGMWSGIGVSANMFNPSVGTQTLTYTYTDVNACVNSATTIVNVTTLPTASISYAGAPYCISVSTPQAVTLTGMTGGVFSSTSGLQLSPTSGAIIPNAPGSVAGTYLVSYTIAPIGGCASVVATTSVTVNSLPVVGANSSAPSVCSGGSITLTGSGALSYVWDNGLVLDATPFIPLFTKTYTVIGTDVNGCQNTASVGVVVKPIPSVASTSPASRCGTGPVTLGATASAGSINWYTGISGGSPIMTGPFYTASVSITTPYYVAATSNGCSSARTAVVATVNAVPTVSFSGLNSAYCLNATSATLVGSPIGGTFSGNGISGNTFSPLTATAGLHTITYTYNDGNCSNSSTFDVTVNALPTVSFTGLNSAYCITAAAATLVGSPLGGTFTGAGVSGNTFTPSIATAGLHSITYTYTDGNSCTNSTIQNVTVNALPTVSFTGLNSAYCIDAAPANLVGSPLGGTFSGTGISGSTFTASVATEGLHIITYNYTDGNSCTNSATQNVTVNALPIVNAGTDITVCSNSSPLTLGGIPSGGIWSGIGVSANMFTPSFGTQTLTYTYTDANSCVNSDNAVINVTTLPSAGISYSGASFCHSVATPQAVVLTGTGGSFSSTSGLYLDLLTGAITPSLSITGPYTVSYTIPAASGCPEVISTTSVTINALPSVIANSSAISAVCAGTAVTLTGSGSSGVVYTWDNSVIDGMPFNALNTTTYTVTGTDQITYCQQTATITVTVIPAPIVNPIIGSAVVCEGTLNSAYTVDLHTYGQPLPPTGGHGSPGDLNDGAVNNYAWSYSGTAVLNATSSVNGITMNFAPGATSGILTVVETIPTSGCSYTNTLSITVNALPTASAGGSTTINNLDSATVSGATATNGSISWTHNGLGTLSNATTLTPTYKPVLGDVGNAVVLTMTVTSPSCGIATASYTVNVISAKYKISGTVKYNSDPNPELPLVGYKVKLLSGSVVIDSVITNASGYYEFMALNGTYTIEPEASATAYWYGDFDDVLAIYDYVVTGPPLPGENAIRLLAADVNLDGDINFTDVTALYDRVVNGYSADFTAPDFVFETPTVIVNNAVVVKNILGLSAGNIYGSNTTP
ncbi:MAG: beta strand repeat-containing protein, partial [Bacteroidales bacterium]